jgi:hypothetical protein
MSAQIGMIERALTATRGWVRCSKRLARFGSCTAILATLIRSFAAGDSFLPDIPRFYGRVFDRLTVDTTADPDPPQAVERSASLSARP